MAKVSSWSGNITSTKQLSDGELEKLVKFIDIHEDNYIYGAGKIGKALRHYCKEAGLNINGNLTSDNLASIKENYQTGKIGIIIGISDKYLQEVLETLSLFVSKTDIYCLTSEKRESMGNIFSIEQIEKNFWINIFVTNICNLNCRSCSTFAPVCSPDYYKLDDFKKDIKQLHRLDLTNINFLKFTGGEPFLHPQLLELFQVARDEFPNIPFECYTNGIALKNISGDILQSLQKLKIRLVVTEYPLEQLKLQTVYEKLDANGVEYSVIFSEGQKFFNKRPLNFDKATPKYMFYYCPRYNFCDSLFMYKGKLFKCIYVITAEYFNHAFNTDLKVTDSDYLDLYHISKEDIYDFTIRRLPYCGYCTPIEELVPWSLSERKIEEWT